MDSSVITGLMKEPRSFGSLGVCLGGSSLSASARLYLHHEPDPDVVVVLVIMGYGVVEHGPDRSVHSIHVPGKIVDSPSEVDRETINHRFS